MDISWFKRTFVAVAASTACIVSIGGPLAVVAASPDAPDQPAATPAPAVQPQWQGARHRGADPLLAAVWQLNLTPEQQASIHKLIDSARQTQRTEAQTAAGTSPAALGNPGDPNYDAAVAAAKARAAARIQARSELNGQIYAVLRPDQQAQLTQVLADMQSKAHARHGHSKENG